MRNERGERCELKQGLSGILVRFGRNRKLPNVYHFGECPRRVPQSDSQSHPMSESDLHHRTRIFALDVIRLVATLPADFLCQHITRQLLRAATSVAANYRAACHARSRSEFVAKLGIVEEESDESGFWLELLVDSGFLANGRARPLIEEAQAILRMICRSITTARRNRAAHPIR
jgi:four helix bundle protein